MTEAVLSMGESAYKMSFEDMQADVLASGNEVLSCFNCHANEPGTMVVTHSYITKALGDDLKRVDGSVLACAQCHIDYYMAPGTGVVTPPWTSLESANPDSMLEYFNKLMVEDENGNSLVYADYVNPDNGVRQVMVNHPEFETFTGEGSIHRDMFTCADCHMGMAVAADGTAYKSHYLISPLQNQELIDKTCSKCHSDLAADVKKIRDETTRRETEIGQDLEALLADITECVNGGKYTDEELDAIRMSYRNAQWYWNFTYVENSEGAHNSKLTYECLDKAEAGIEATRALMRK
jgi:nitrite reductase (cytochrome c-552)